MEKTCKHCGKVLDLSNFPIREYHTDGSPAHRPTCRDCYNTIRRGKRPAEESSNEDMHEVLVKALAELAEYSIDLLGTITKEQFIESTGCTLAFSFTDLKSDTYKYLDSLGIGNPATIDITDAGNILVIGDTYGQHTRSGMFELVKQICKHFNVSKIVAVGRQLDEDDHISNCFEKLPVPVIFVATADEVAKLHKLNETIGGQICRESVNVHGVHIRNQEQITPYVKKSVTSLDPLIFKGNCIVNLTRQEYGRRSFFSDSVFVASPGCLSEPFVPKVRNKLLIKGGITVAQVYSHSFKKYRKAEEDKTLWQQGCILLMNNGSVVQPAFLQIKKVEDVYTTAFNGTVITEQGVCKADSLTVVASDIHAPKYDKWALSSFLNYLNFTKPEEVVLNGDIADMEAFNHHILSRGETPSIGVADSLIALETVLGSVREAVGDSSKLSVVLGNHSDFMMRWTKKNPQFQQFLSDVLYSIFKDNKVDYVHPSEDWLVTGNRVAVLHGESYIANSGNTNTEKTARTFGTSIIGHSHSTNLRFGCLRTGCLCAFDQGYNSPYGNWDHSFGVITTYKDCDFISPMFIEFNGVILDGFSEYKPNLLNILKPNKVTVTFYEECHG